MPLSKFCGLGPVGFPKEQLKCRQISGFPFMLSLRGHPPQNRIAT